MAWKRLSNPVMAGRRPRADCECYRAVFFSSKAAGCSSEAKDSRYQQQLLTQCEALTGVGFPDTAKLRKLSKNNAPTATE